MEEDVNEDWHTKNRVTVEVSEDVLTGNCNANGIRARIATASYCRRIIGPRVLKEQEWLALKAELLLAR